MYLELSKGYLQVVGRPDLFGWIAVFENPALLHIGKYLDIFFLNPQSQLDKKSNTKRQSKILGMPKLLDANNAGTTDSKDCTLILTEGDSAKALAVSGLGVVGRDHYGVFPLRGKILNVRDATHKQVSSLSKVKICRATFFAPWPCKNSVTLSLTQLE